MNQKRVALSLTILLLILSAYTSCEPFRPGWRTEKTSTLGNPMREGKTEFALSQYQQIDRLSVCIDKMILTNAAGTTTSVPYNPKSEINIPMNGAELGLLSVPPGQYTQISLELADVCGLGRSISLTNSQGNFTSQSPMSLKFSGNEFVGSSQQTIVFNIRPLAGSLSEVNSNGALVAQASASSGPYHSQNCGMATSTSSVAFCDTFDQPHPISGRSGQLNGSLWTVARTGVTNLGQGMLNQWRSSTINACGTNQPANPGGSDIVICNGQLRESTNDGGAMTTLTMSPNQRFDFAGRKGTIAFDITHDGRLGVWPEIWISDQYIPGPHTRWEPTARARNGIGIRLGAIIRPNEVKSWCAQSNNFRWGVDSVQVIRNFAHEELVAEQNSRNTPLACATSSPGAGNMMNHIELVVSQNEIEVWATDAGSPILKRISIIRDLNLPFTNGYITLGDYHYNPATYGDPQLTNHTFAWDNIAFDGPKIPGDFVASVSDELDAASPESFNLGWVSPMGSPATVSTEPIPAAKLAAAQAGARAVLTTNFIFHDAATVPALLNYSVNGVPLSAVLPFSNNAPGDQFAMELPVPASALVEGPQLISIWANDVLIFSNVDVRLIGAGN